MKQTIQIDCPAEILLNIHLNAEGFAEYLKRQAAISLFKEGKLSSCRRLFGDATYRILIFSDAGWRNAP
jgi:hypothetical protein